MTKQEKAKIILEALEEYIQVNYSFEEYYIKGIINGLNEIEKQEKEGVADNGQQTNEHPD